MKIAIIGGFGYDDVGDEAMLTNDILNIKNNLPQAEIKVLSDNPAQTYSFHRINAYNSIKAIESNILFSAILKFFPSLFFMIFRSIINLELKQKGRKKFYFALNKNIANLIDNIKDCDVLFNIGGGNLTSTYEKEFYRKLLTYHIALKLNKRIILSGQTVGPFNNVKHTELAREYLNEAEIITLRDVNDSKRTLKNIGVSKPLIKCTVDDAMTLPVLSKHKTNEIMKKENIILGKFNIAINVREWKAISTDKTVSFFSEVSNYLISRYGATIIFVPMQFGKKSGDLKIINKVIDNIENRENVFLIKNNILDVATKSIISKCDLAIGMRYHFIVFSLSSGVPSISIAGDEYYSFKMNGINDIVDNKESVFNIDEKEDFYKKIDDCVRYKEMIAEKLNKEIDKLKNLSNFAISKI